MERIAPKGEHVILAHLRHLKEHGEKELVKQGLEYLKRHNIPINLQELHHTPKLDCGCSGSSELRQWPVQLHQLNPQAGYFQRANVLLASDCSAFASGNFLERFLKCKILAIACPKLDHNTDSYVDKLRSMIDDARIDTLTVLIMEVPCCGGLLQMALKVREMASRNIPIKKIVLSVEGKVKSEEWV